jgi:CubicO group peptidase (beta-lactamase class C family)
VKATDLPRRFFTATIIAAPCAVRWLFVSTWLAASTGACSGSDSSAGSVDALVERVRTDLGMPGIQVAVVSDGHVAWAKAYGRAVIAPLPERAMRDDTVLELASISKEIVAVAFMQEVEAGRFGLDDDINAALPWPVRNPHFPGTPITWRMVLSHTSSIADDPRAFNSFTMGSDSPVPLADLMRDLYAPTGRYNGNVTFLQSEPGSTFLYSTTAVSLAAYAIELAAGRAYHEVVRERIFEPIGMDSASYFMSDFPQAVLAVGYTCDPVGPKFQCDAPGDPQGSVLDQQHSVPQYPALLLRSSAAEYGKFMAMIMNGGKGGDSAVLSSTSVRQLLEPQPLQTDYGAQQGLVFFGISTTNGRSESILWGHGGLDLGVATAAFFDVNAGVGVVVLGNAQNSEQTNTDALIDLAIELVDEFR